MILLGCILTTLIAVECEYLIDFFFVHIDFDCVHNK